MKNYFTQLNGRWQLAIIVGAVVLLIGIFAMVEKSCNKPDVEKEKEQIEELKKEEANINANIRRLEQEAAAKGAEVNIRREDHNGAKNTTNEARNATNEALENVNRTANGNFSNSSLDRANQARCKAFPEDCL